ncbi:MAG: hypothetical protein WCF90_00190 [Methanomicrobiales archaeon]
MSEEAEKIARDKNLRVKFIRFMVVFAVSIPVMVATWIPLPLPSPQLGYVILVISTPALAFVAYPIFRTAWISHIHRMLSMDVIHAMGIGVTLASSVLGTFGSMLTHEFMFYDTAIMLAAFLMLIRFLEGQATGRTAKSIKKLALSGSRRPC